MPYVPLKALRWRQSWYWWHSKQPFSARPAVVGEPVWQLWQVLMLGTRTSEVCWLAVELVWQETQSSARCDSWLKMALGIQRCVVLVAVTTGSADGPCGKSN